MMEQAVQDRRRNDRVPKDLCPLAKALVEGENDGASLLAARDELEEEVGAVLVNGDVAVRINDQPVFPHLSLPFEIFLCSSEGPLQAVPHQRRLSCLNNPHTGAKS
jgi:8-oxo-dGTP pyrophosphatase MutT (NUDIX family)